jgi:hypothetical protein
MKIETYKGIVSITDEAQGARSRNFEAIKNMPLVRFKSHKNPFLMLKQFCNNLECDCNNATLEFTEIDETGASLPGQIQFYFILNLQNWTEDEKIVRSELCQSFVDEFINDLSEEMKNELKESVKYNKEKAKQAAKFDISLNNINEGRLVSYAEVFSHSGSITCGGHGYGFGFDDTNESYVIDDLYCIDPICKCNLANLVFLKVDKKTNEVSDKFVAILDFNNGVKIEDNTLPEKYAKKIFDSWLKSDPDAIYVLKERYGEIKEMGEKIVEKHTGQKRIFSQAKNVKIGRNEPCPCGSGKKYKKCCGG